jgi:hypothetical protein
MTESESGRNVDPIQARNGRIADQLLGLTSHPRNARFSKGYWIIELSLRAGGGKQLHPSG